MQQTTNYQLPQWEAGDRIRRGDFNGAMSAIDAAIKSAIDASTAVKARIYQGTYYGKGTYGASNQNVITFPKEPLAVFIGSEDYSTMFVRVSNNAVAIGPTGNSKLYLTWGVKQVFWYTTGSAVAQLNTANQYYPFVALLAET